MDEAEALSQIIITFPCVWVSSAVQLIYDYRFSYKLGAKGNLSAVFYSLLNVINLTFRNSESSAGT